MSRSRFWGPRQVDLHLRILWCGYALTRLRRMCRQTKKLFGILYGGHTGTSMRRQERQRGLFGYRVRKKYARDSTLTIFQTGSKRVFGKASMGPKSRSAKRRSRAFGFDLVAVRSEIMVLRWCSPYYQTPSRR